MNDVKRILFVAVEKEDYFDYPVPLASTHNDPLSVAGLSLAVAAHSSPNKRFDFGDPAATLSRVCKVPLVPAKPADSHDE